MKSTATRAAPFAHLFGGGARAAKAEGDMPKDEKDTKAKRGASAEDDEDDKERAEEPDLGAGEENEDEGVDKDEKPGLGDVEDPDDSLDEDAAPEETDSDPKVRKGAKSGRKAERQRWAKVMGHAATAGRVPAACQLLSTTSMSAKRVIGTLAALPAEQPKAQGGLRERMAQRPAPAVGPDRGAPAGGDDFGAQMAAAMKKVRG